MERQYNQSLNSNKINSVSNMFSSSKMIDKFFRSVGFNMNNVDSEIKEKISYISYYKFLSEEFKDYGHFSAYLKEIADDWKRKDNNIDVNDAVYYLLNVFVVSPVEGKIKEIQVEKKVRETFKDFKVTNPTAEQDIEECWDLKVSNDDITFYLQVKTRNFFYGLKRTSKYSFYKIEKAANRYNLPIFFVKEDFGKIMINLPSEVNHNETEFIEIQDFDFDSYTQDEIEQLADDTFICMHKENNI